MNERDRRHIDRVGNAILSRLDDLIRLTKRNIAITKENTVSVAELEEQVAQVETRISENTSATASVTELLNEVAQLVRDNVGDPAALEALAARLTAASSAQEGNNQVLVDAVFANSDVDPTPPA